MVTDLTGMDLANASLLDEATAAAEAMALLKRSNRKKSNLFLVDRGIHPQTLDVVKTRAEYFGFEVVVGELEQLLDEHDAFGVMLQYPRSCGAVIDIEPIIAKAKAQKAMSCVAADLLSLVLLKAPGEMGADVVFGSAQRFGVPMGFGGPQCRLLCHHRKTEACDSWTDDRCVDRQPRQSGTADGDADPRAAYPPREGHFQHLYRSGTAGQYGRFLRHLPRSGRPETDRRPGSAFGQYPSFRVLQAAKGMPNWSARELV